MKAHAIYEEASAKGALEAEVQRLRTALQKILDLCDCAVDQEIEDIARQALSQ